MRFVKEILKEVQMIDKLLQQSITQKTVEKNLLDAAKQTNLIGKAASNFQAGIPLTDHLTQNLHSMIESYQIFGERINIYTDPFNKWVTEAVNHFPQKVKEAISIFSDKGWFYDIDMPTSVLFHIADLYKKGNDQEADEALYSYFQKNLNDIKTNLISNNPKRKEILLSIFSAHNRQDYNLSIPVIFSQIDGICFDEAQKDFFIRANGKPKIASYTESFRSDKMMEALLAPINELKLSIYKGKSERSPDYNELNRHQVLHGEVTDYGTQENSLQAISLLNYVNKALMLCREEGNERTAK